MTFMTATSRCTESLLKGPSCETGEGGMKNVLLLQSPLMFYRVPIYNKLAAYLWERGYCLHVWPLSASEGADGHNFHLISRPMTRANLRAVVTELDVDLMINHLVRRKPSIGFYVYSLLLAKARNIRTAYYGHGLNLSRRGSPLQIFASNLLHLLCDRIILYTPDEKKYLWPTNRRKVSVASNTLDLEGRDRLVTRPKAAIRREWGFRQPRLVLFSGRIQKRKRLDVLIDSFRSRGRQLQEWGLVIVGPGMDESQRAAIAAYPDIYYVGPVYDEVRMAEVFHVSDVFSIPGSMGLGIVEALYWGKPIVTLNARHGPEAYYLSKANSFVCGDEREYQERLVFLMSNSHIREEMSAAARQSYLRHCTMAGYLQGFWRAIREGDARGPAETDACLVRDERETDQEMAVVSGVNRWEGLP